MWWNLVHSWVGCMVFWNHIAGPPISKHITPPFHHGYPHLIELTHTTTKSFHIGHSSCFLDDHPGCSPYEYGVQSRKYTFIPWMCWISHRRRHVSESPVLSRILVIIIKYIDRTTLITRYAVMGYGGLSHTSGVFWSWLNYIPYSPNYISIGTCIAIYQDVIIIPMLFHNPIIYCCPDYMSL